MQEVDFLKMSGSGNDFIIVDNREGVFDGDRINDFVKRVCRRKVSVGADGFILIEKSDETDFGWRFFNADGSEAEMCGNGGRCVAKFAYVKGIAGKDMSFETLAGVIRAEILEDTVKLEMGIPNSIGLDQELAVEGQRRLVSFINTGVPHAVEFVSDLGNFEVTRLGRLIRYHDRYRPAGTNVNFASVYDRSNMVVRTYERGVEDETLACGTGAVASVLIAYEKGMVSSQVAVKTRGGWVLSVHFKHVNGAFEEVFLEGDARVIYEGHLWEDA